MNNTVNIKVPADLAPEVYDFLEVKYNERMNSYKQMRDELRGESVLPAVKKAAPKKAALKRVVLKKAAPKAPERGEMSRDIVAAVESAPAPVKASDVLDKILPTWGTQNTKKKLEAKVASVLGQKAASKNSNILRVKGNEGVFLYSVKK